MRYTERLADAGIAASVGSVGDSYDNALAETINGLYKTELISRGGPGGASTTSSSPPRSGSTGSTIAASTSTAATSHPPTSRPPTTLAPASRRSAEVSQQAVSGHAGAVHRTRRGGSHTWLGRYEDEGLDGLADRSHRPRSCPHQMPAAVEARVLELRRTHPGGVRGGSVLSSPGRVALVPSRSGIYRALVRPA